MIKLSIIITSHNTKDLLAECIASVQKFCQGIAFEIIVVDNNSQDGTVAFLKNTFPKVILIENAVNAGYARANNKGIERAHGEFVMILNSDTVLLESPAKLIGFMEKDRSVGLAGCAIYSSRMTPRSSVRRSPGLLSELYAFTLFSVKDPAAVFHALKRKEKYRSVIADADWVEGCFMLARKSTLARVGNMDERYFLYYEDTDLCYAIRRRAGLRVVHYPDMSIRHAGGGSTTFSDAASLDRYYRSCNLFFRKHKGAFYAWFFSVLCCLGWIALFLALKVVSLFRRSDQLGRKIAMLSYVIAKHALGKETDTPKEA